MAGGLAWFDITWNLLAVAGLVLLNGFFVAAEFAIVKVRETQLQARTAPTKAAALHVVHHLDAYLSACQLGITVSSLGLGWIGEPAVSHLIVEPLLGHVIHSQDALQATAFAIAFLFITALHIVVGEMAPKTLAIRKPEATALWVAVPLGLFRKAFAPLIWVLNGAANSIVRLLGVEPVGGTEADHSIDELRILLTRAAGPSKMGQSAQVASRVFGLQELAVRDIMVPRDRMVCVDVQNSFEENIHIVEQNAFTRFPLADGGPDSILGFVHQRDVFAAAKSTPRPRIEELRREVHVVPTAQRVNATLFEMLDKRRPLAVVVNEFGVTVGIVTLDDIFEEVVGALPEDFDRSQAHLRVLAPGHYLVDAAMPLHELQLVLREPLEERRASTLAGLLNERLGRIPAEGDSTQIGNYRYVVRQADRHRVRSVEVKRVAAEAAP